VKLSAADLRRALAIKAEIERIDASTRAHRWTPHEATPKQAEFLRLDTYEALYGGAAGGGKTDCLLMAALAHVDVPGYAALLLRRTFPQLKQPGGLVPRSHEWLQGTAATWNEVEKRWTFPSGATVSFGHVQHETDRYNYQGGEYQFIGFDELTQFSRTIYDYMHSRARRVQGCPVEPRIRSASNPGGVGHDWVKERFVEPGDKSRPFVASRIEDNPHLDQAGYRRALSNLDELTRLQLEEGVWLRDDRGLVYPLHPRNIVSASPPRDASWKYVFCVDLGASEREATTATAVLGWSMTVPGTVYVLESEATYNQDAQAFAEQYARLRAAYGPFVHTVMDEGGLGRLYADELRRRHAIPVEAAEKHSKLGFRRLLRGAIERAELLIVEPANGGLISEMGSLPWNEAGTDAEDGFADHLTDAVLYGWRACLAYAAKAKPTEPTHGTPEWFKAEEAKHMERERKALREQKARWQRR
jgi:hypothetical protein